jgi:hypothetical protein
MDDNLEEFEDDVLEIEVDLEELESGQGVTTPSPAVKKPRMWRSVEEYMEERRLRDALSEYEYDF